jgi:C_GCAxxG_C_C family probable redox protein
LTEINALPERAEEYFKSGLGCAEAVYQAFSDTYPISSDTVQRIASMYQGGMCLNGLTCGTLVGGLMVIGAHLSSSSPDEKEQRQQAQASGSELINWYQEQQGSTTCAGLLGINLSIPEEAEKFGPGGYLERVCVPLVKETCQWMIDNIFTD